MDKKKILIVEDELIIAEDLQQSLQRLGYKVTGIAANGRDALEKAAADIPDLALMDIMIRGKSDGITIAKRLKDAFNIPAIYLTAYADERILNRAKIIAPYSYIIKPFDEKELYTNIEIALERSHSNRLLQRSNIVLKTIRNVNKLIVRERNSNKLITQVCKILTGDGAYPRAWVALLDPKGRLKGSSQSGWGKKFQLLKNLLKEGKTPDCGKRAILQEKVILSKGSEHCHNCPFQKYYPKYNNLTISLRSHGGIFGLMSVAMTDRIVADKAEVDLFKELADDIAFALYNMGLEEKIHTSEKKYRTLFEDSKDAIYISTKNGQMIDFNKSMEKLLGFNEKELHNLNVKKLYVDKNAQKKFQLMIEKNGFVKDLEVLVRKKDGTIIDCLETASVRKDANGNIVVYEGFLRDVSKQKAVDKALIESEEKFRGVIEQSNDGIYVLQDDRFVFINPRFTEITGFKLEEISGEGFDFRELVADEGLVVLEERAKKLKQGEEVPDRYIFKGLHHNGQKRDLEVSVTMVDWEGKPATLGVLRDVTEQIQTRTDLEKALEEAKQGEKVKSLFMANMSHEIRTPLNAILGFTELIENSTRHFVGKEEQEFFDIIRTSGNRLMHTVHEVLDISQIEAGTYDLKMKKLDLCSLVPGIVNACKPMSDKKGLKLTYRSSLKTAWVKADQNGVSQSISNIIDNAIKYTKKGNIAVTLKEKSEQYILIIEDTGIGISDEYLVSIFDTFSQESEGYTKKFQGIGLGMAITKSHLDMNHIGINVRSKKNKGTIFTLTFNAMSKQKQVQKIKKIVREKPIIELENKPMILVVEDDRNSQRLVEFFLKGQYNICLADSVGVAKERLKGNSIEFVLLDLSLVGNEDGLDLVRWMRKTKTWKETPVIATTAHAFTQDRDNCLSAGCNDYLSKPISKEKLLDKINSTI